MDINRMMIGVKQRNQSTIVLIGLLTGIALTACSNHIPSHALRLKGDRAVSIRDWPAAAGWYEQLVDRDQTNWKAQAALGHAALEAGDLSTARRSLEIASALKPSDADVAQDLSETLELQEAWDDLFAYLQSRATTTSSASDWLRLARVAIEADDPDTAREAIRTAIAVDGAATVGPYLRAARLARRLGDDGDAFRALSLAWQLDPDNEDVQAALRDIGVVPGPTMRLTQGQ